MSQSTLQNVVKLIQRSGYRPLTSRDDLTALCVAGFRKTLMGDRVIQYKHFEIDADLRGLVKYLWLLEAQPNKGDYFIFRTFSSICPTLFIIIQGYVKAIGQDANGSTLIVSQSNKWSRFKTSNDFKLLGITLYPFTIPLVFGIPASLMTNKIWGRNELKDHATLAVFCQRLANSDHNVEHLKMLIRETLSRMEKRDHAILQLINSLASEKSEITDCLHDRVHMSQRNFERKFKFYSGFTPTTFQNVIRSINSFESIALERKQLSDVVFEHNYFDHAHFSNEFKRHTGFQPKLFARREKQENLIWTHFVEFFQFLSIFPPVLCKTKQP